MPTRRLRIKSLRDSNWTSRARFSILPSFLDDAPLNPTGYAKRLFVSFCQYVDDQRFPKGLKGSKSLKDAAIEVLLQNLSLLDNLDDIPKHIASRIWHTLNKRCMLSFHSWKIIGKVLHLESNITFGMLKYREAITSPTLPLLAYTEPLISKNFEFITSLSIIFSYSMADLVQLARISNLGILEIIHPRYPQGGVEPSPSSVGDLLIRAWSREAEENGAFSVLRILRLWNHLELTTRSLRYFHSFPSLAVVDINWGFPDRINIVPEAEDLGWNSINDMETLDILEAKCPNRAMDCETSNYETSYIMLSEARLTKSLWDGSKVHRASRHSSNSVHTQVGTKCDSGSDTARSSRLNLFRAPAMPDYVKEAIEGDGRWESLNWELFNEYLSTSWEFDNAACWARVGEIRNDNDLIRSGVRGVEEKAFVGPHLISPVRMAHILLGDLGEFKAMGKKRSIKLVSKSLDKQSYQAFVHDGQFISSAPPSKAISDSRLDKTGGGKKRARGSERVRRNKKQKLKDVLNGFMDPGSAKNTTTASRGP